MGETLRRAPGALWLSTSGTVVALSPDGSEPAVIAGSGASLWAAFEQPTRVDQVLADLAARFRVTPEAIRPDVEAAIEALLKLGLLEEVA